MNRWLVCVLLLMGCQSRSEFLLERGRAAILRGFDDTRVWVTFEFMEVDRRLRLERGRVNGLPAREARAQFHAEVAALVFEHWDRMDCLDRDDDVEMMRLLVVAKPELSAKWAERREHCREESKASAAAAEAAELRDLVESARGRLLVFIEEPTDVIMRTCLAANLYKLHPVPVLFTTKKDAESAATRTEGRTTEVSLGTVTVRIIDAKARRETRKLFTGELVSAVDVPVGVGVAMLLQPKGEPARALVAAYDTSESKDPKLDPDTIARDENLWPQLCEKLNEAVKRNKFTR